VSYLPTGSFLSRAHRSAHLVTSGPSAPWTSEDLAAGITHLSEVYRLHRPDGSEYPVDELPRDQGAALRYHLPWQDIVVHRADGRRVRLLPGRPLST